VQLRSAARDPLGAAGVRRPPRPERGVARMTASSTAVATTQTAEGHAREGGISNVILGMLLFITSEVMFFAGLFAAYFNVRATSPQWPPIDPATSQPFHIEILPLVGPATVLLILSSFTCQLGVWAIRRG